MPNPNPGGNDDPDPNNNGGFFPLNNNANQGLSPPYSEIILRLATQIALNR
jgi:hypothetical protein